MGVAVRRTDRCLEMVGFVTGKTLFVNKVTEFAGVKTKEVEEIQGRGVWRIKATEMGVVSTTKNRTE